MALGGTSLAAGKDYRYKGNINYMRLSVIIQHRLHVLVATGFMLKVAYTGATVATYCISMKQGTPSAGENPLKYLTECVLKKIRELG